MGRDLYMERITRWDWGVGASAVLVLACAGAALCFFFSAGSLVYLSLGALIALIGRATMHCANRGALTEVVQALLTMTAWPLVLYLWAGARSVKRSAASAPWADRVAAATRDGEMLPRATNTSVEMGQ